MTQIHVCRRLPIITPHGEAHLLGLGRSLDDAPRQGGRVVNAVGVNEAALMDPGCLCIAWDLPPVLRVHEWCTSHGKETPDMLVEHAVWSGKRGPGAEWVAHSPYNSYYRREDVVAADARPGTACVALVLLADAGVKRVRLVGFDAYVAWRRADSWPLPDEEWARVCQPAASIQAIWSDLGYTPRQDRKQDSYLRINKAIRRVALKNGLSLLDPEGEPL